MKIWHVIAHYEIGCIDTFSVHFDDVPNVIQVLDLIEESKLWRSGHLETEVYLEEAYE